MRRVRVPAATGLVVYDYHVLLVDEPGHQTSLRRVRMYDTMLSATKLPEHTPKIAVKGSLDPESSVGSAHEDPMWRGRCGAVPGRADDADHRWCSRTAGGRHERP